jgi:hypothetical protein
MQFQTFTSEASFPEDDPFDRSILGACAQKQTKELRGRKTIHPPEMLKG